MPDSENGDLDGLDELDEFELAALAAGPSPRRLPSWLVNPAHDAGLLPHACDLMVAFLAEPDLQLGYDDQFREYFIAFADRDSSVVMIYHCPFCGDKLPGSVREEWFDRISAMDLEPEDALVPIDMRSGAWWRAAGL